MPARSGSTRASPGTEGCPSGLSARSTRNSRDHGIELSPQGVFPLKTKGRLPAGDYAIAADVSSQFIGGLLFALSVVPGTSTLTLTGRIESAPYIDMTLDVLALFGARITRSEDGADSPSRGSSG